MNLLAPLDERIREETVRAENAGLPRRYLDGNALLRVFTALHQNEDVEAAERSAPASCERCAQNRIHGDNGQ